MEPEGILGQPDALVEPHSFLHPILVPELPSPVRLGLARMPGSGGHGDTAMDGLHRLVGLDEELQLHLLELPGPEGKIARRDLIAKRLADLGNAERNLLTGRLQHVLELGENGLRGFRTQIGDILVRLNGTHIGLQH